MRRTLVLFAVPALLLAGCGSDDSQNPAGSGSSSQDSSSGPTLELASSDLGQVVVDQDGMTLYMFVPDQKQDGTPTCYEDCAEAWPALEGEASAGGSIDESLIGTVERKDGTQQVTYDGLPLYHFSGDEKPGDVNGQGLGDVWWVLDEAGAPIEEKIARVSVATTDLGDVLVDQDGMTLYMFVPDQQKDGKPTCYGDCAEAWPALEGGESGALPGEGADESLLGTVERTDGAQQVTYNDLPLYHFSGDKKAGDVNGQGLSDVWWVVDSAGDPIMKSGK
jgi:predicted lipoprotein with Yx(FWY)xxD motif